jgi:hypothetical protein
MTHLYVDNDKDCLTVLERQKLESIYTNHNKEEKWSVSSAFEDYLG